MKNEKLAAAVTFFTLCIVISVVWYVLKVAGDELAAMTRLVVHLSGIVLTTGLAGIFVYLAFRAGINLISGGLIAIEQVEQEREKTAEYRAKRCLAENEADVQVVTTGEAVFVREMNRRATWLPLHLNPSHRINGAPATPTAMEIATWQMWTQRAVPRSIEPMVDSLPSPAKQWPPRLNLMELLPLDGPSLQNIILGATIDQDTGDLQTISASLEQLVHIAVGGETDSGKSNFGRVLAYQILTTAEDVRAILVDLGRTTFKPFADNSRLLYPLVDNETDCLAVLRELMGEAHRRSQLFDRYPTVEKLSHYNRLVGQPEPYIVAFLDEVTDLFEHKDIQVTARRLIRMSRKFGIYLVAVGQSWKHTDLDTSIRRQFRTAVHFAARDAGSSRTLLNAPDAVNISQQGRAFAALPFGLASDLIELQTPYLDLATVMAVLERQHQPSGPAEPLPVIEPTTEETQILELVAQKKSISAIATEVYGSKGGPQNAKVRNVIEKFDAV